MQPASSGFTTQWVNAGDLRNQGVEIGLNAFQFQTKILNGILQ